MVRNTQARLDTSVVSLCLGVSTDEMKALPPTKPHNGRNLPVKFAQAEIDVLDSAAAALGVSRHALMRIATMVGVRHLMALPPTEE